ncbi:uncharacterized protein LOC108628167, partial [Ceratina calcarata]|uniref:Uncharacterized protein LOC108628167 n=1 Tax=Ceratina calcarata TaxID=156304 RepID=A0AAJ7J642_9HYME
MKQKLMCLPLYKTSGAVYRFLSAWFKLPSKGAINRLLQKIPLSPGINDVIIQNVEEAVRCLKKHEKFCLLMFDEISLTYNIEYNTYTDKIEGVYNGDIIDHALVFMLKGITRKWKQTICYFFNKGPIKPEALKELIREVIRKFNGVNGLKIIATICDQGPTKRTAIERLIDDARNFYLRNNVEPKRRIVIDNNEIVPMYDVPRLLIGIRNNLLKKDLIWKKNNEDVQATWKDIITAYEIDCDNGDLRMMPRITEFHVYEDKIERMKVSYAAEIFSYKVAVAINLMARN